MKWSEARRRKCYNGFLKVVTNSHRLKFLFQVDGKEMKDDDGVSRDVVVAQVENALEKKQL